MLHVVDKKNYGATNHDQEEELIPANRSIRFEEIENQVMKYSKKTENYEYYVSNFMQNFDSFETAHLDYLEEFQDVVEDL
jgi:adenine C2-methylase RlmN of 23S rRNA A2503 and tRNA A37